MKYLLSIVLVVIVAVSAAAAPAPLPSSPFGISGLKPRYGKDLKNVWRVTWQLGNYMEDAGVRWDRAEIAWSDVQSTPEHWDWSFTDQMVKVYNERPIHAYVLLEGSAPWMSGPPRTEAELEQYGEFVFRTVDRYKETIRAWEIWNEPNIPAFWKEPSARDYAALLKVAYQAAKRADPDCTIITGGTSGVDAGFLRDVLHTHGGWEFCDAVAIHPYSMSGGPASQDLAELLRLTKVVATKDGVTRPLWITEVGWTTDTTRASELRQAEYLVQEYAIALAHGVEKVFWFTLGDWGEKWGLLAGYKNVPDWGYTSTNRTKPAYYALKHLTEALAPSGGRPRFLGYLPDAGGVTAMAFLGDGSPAKPVVIAWSPVEEEHTLSLPQNSGLHARSAHGPTVPSADDKIRVTEVPVTITGFQAGALKAASLKADPTLRVPGRNIVLNPSMELGVSDRVHFWNAGRFPDGGKDAALEWSSDAHEGARSISLKNARDGAWHSTPIPVEAGKRYTLRAWAKPTAANGENTMTLAWYSGNMWTWLARDAAESVVGTGDWREVSVTATAPKDAVFVRIVFASKDNDGAIAWDDVSLTEAAP